MEKRQLIIGISAFILLFSLNPHKILADDIAGTSAVLQNPEIISMPKITEDTRVKLLGQFLTKCDSPLAPYASDLVENADKYNLDWKLVAAISGVESTFGQQIPDNSYNGWGWGIYGNNVTRFSSWHEGIATISKGLRENYMNKLKTTDVYEIGKYYAASPTWAGKVDYFMNNIQQFALANYKGSLSLSL